MNKDRKFLLSVAVGIVAVGATAAPALADNIAAKQEKCYGVVAKGMNDCAAASHSCAGQSSEDAHPEEWVYVPAGLCDRLSGGASESKKNSG